MSKREAPSVEFRELKASFDALQKDARKKDSRSDALMKELVSVRATAANYLVSL